MFVNICAERLAHTRNSLCLSIRTPKPQCKFHMNILLLPIQFPFKSRSTSQDMLLVMGKWNVQARFPKSPNVPFSQKAPLSWDINTQELWLTWDMKHLPALVVYRNLASSEVQPRLPLEKEPGQSLSASHECYQLQHLLLVVQLPSQYANLQDHAVSPYITT